MIGAILVWAWYTLLLREKPVDLPSDVLLAASVIAGLCLMLAALPLKGPAQVELTPANMLAIIYIAVFASLLGFLFWSHGIAVIGPERGGQFVHLMPVFGSIMAVLFLGERLTIAHMIRAAFIVTGLVLVNRQTRP